MQLSAMDRLSHVKTIKLKNPTKIEVLASLISSSGAVSPFC